MGKVVIIIVVVVSIITLYSWRLCCGFAWDFEGDNLGIITTNSSQVKLFWWKWKHGKSLPVFCYIKGDTLGLKRSAEKHHWYWSSGSIDLYTLGEIICTDGCWNSQRKFGHLQSSDIQVSRILNSPKEDRIKLRNLNISDGYPFWVSTPSE